MNITLSHNQAKLRGIGLHIFQHLNQSDDHWLLYEIEACTVHPYNTYCQYSSMSVLITQFYPITGQAKFRLYSVKFKCSYIIQDYSITIIYIHYINDKIIVTPTSISKTIDTA